MMKKIVFLALAVACASGLAFASNISTDEAVTAYQEGRAAVLKGEVSSEELEAELSSVANDLGTLSLENNKKALWFVMGAFSVFGAFLFWKFGLKKPMGQHRKTEVEQLGAVPFIENVIQLRNRNVPRG